MKICYVGANAPLLLCLMKDMVKRGHEIHWITLDVPMWQIDGVKRHDDLCFSQSQLIKRNILSPLYLVLFRYILNRISPHIIHAVNVKWSGWLSAISGFHPFIVTAQGMDVMRSQMCDMDPLRKWLRKYTLEHADVVTYGSETMLTDINFWAKPKRVHKYFAGVDFGAFDFRIDSNMLRQELGLGKRKIVFSPRMFEANSNLDILIKTLPFVRKEISEVIFIFSCHLEIDNYSKKMKTLISEIGVGDHCLFLDRIPFEKMPFYYACSDIIISILSSDGMPGTLLEAMAMKKPLILSAIPTYLELNAKDFAYVVGPRNIEQTAQAIVRGLRNKDESNSLSENGYNWVRTHADSLALNDQLERLYKGLRKY